MKRIILTALMAIVALTISGCAKKQVWLSGEVVKISGTLPGLTKSPQDLFAPESVKIAGGSLVYMIRVPDNDPGIFTIDVYEGSRVSRATLMARVCVGTKVRFPVTLVEKTDDRAKLDDNPNLGVGGESADRIIVPVPCLEK